LKELKKIELVEKFIYIKLLKNLNEREEKTTVKNLKEEILSMKNCLFFLDSKGRNILD